MVSFECEYCKRVFGSKNAWASHKGKCKQNPNAKQKVVSEKWLEAMHKRKGEKQNHQKVDFTCPYCKKQYFGKYAEYQTQHINHCSENPNAVKYKGHLHSEAEKLHLSEMAKKNNFGGWHTSKSYIYNGVTLDSTYEVEFAKNLDETGTKWIRPKPLLYKLENVKHRYYPDFYLPEYNVYVDTKNDYLINNVNPRFGITDVEKVKLVESQNDVKIIILDKNHLSLAGLTERLNVPDL